MSAPAKTATANVIDWPGIRAAAVALQNVREAAKRAGADLRPDELQRFIERVNKRSQRENWITPIEPAPEPNERPLSTAVHNGAALLATKLSEDSQATRAALATTARKGAEAFKEKSGDEIITLAKPLQHLTSAAGMIGGWGERGQDQGGDTLILSIGGNVSLGEQHVHNAPLQERIVCDAFEVEGE